MAHSTSAKAHRVGRHVDSKRRVVPSSELHWRKWGEEHVVYDSGSGDTHLMDEMGAKTLQMLETNELRPMQLCRKIAESLNLEANKDLLRRIRSLLEHYHRVGLVETTRR